MKRQAMITVIVWMVKETYERMKAVAENAREAYIWNNDELIQKR